MPVRAFAENPVAELARKIASGEVKLDFDGERGYLASLLKNLDVPVSSQTLVFSKTSLQSERISPATPRAIYFNDDVYVGWAQGATFIEIMAVDTEAGAAFYLLEQTREERPQFARSTGHECSACHYAMESKTFVPKLLMSSVVPDAAGRVEGAFPFDTNDLTPFEQRWGGWVVTGTHGNQKHLGNIVLRRPASPFENMTGAQVVKFDTAKYLSPHSDIVALMVLAHQMQVENLIALARANPTDENAERLVKALTFDGADPLKAPVQGSSNFVAEFARRGPMREFDLKTKLFKSPVSYMINSKSFQELPAAVREYVHRRLN